MEKIYVRNTCSSMEDLLVRKYMLEKEGIKHIFWDKDDRYEVAVCRCLILKDEEPIGFINIVPERIRGVYFLDMGIEKTFQGQGYGKLALKDFFRKFKCDEFIIAETKNDNVLANSSANKFGVLAYQENDQNYYLMNSDLQTFESSDVYENFIDYCKGDKPTQKELIRSIFNTGK
ncbi:MAG: GNAT family N-acetyltransferase [Lactobacillales bacterium]|nr:GNAT family N-acetyltransferase [Lactobacillales bacterium]